MKTYKFERQYSHDVISIGDLIYIGEENVKVIAILKVDFDDGLIWFTGVPTSELE